MRFLLMVSAISPVGDVVYLPPAPRVAPMRQREPASFISAADARPARSPPPQLPAGRARLADNVVRSLIRQTSRADPEPAAEPPANRQAPADPLPRPRATEETAALDQPPNAAFAVSLLRASEAPPRERSADVGQDAAPPPPLTSSEPATLPPPSPPEATLTPLRAQRVLAASERDTPAVEPERDVVPRLESPPQPAAPVVAQEPAVELQPPPRLTVETQPAPPEPRTAALPDTSVPSAPFQTSLLQSDAVAAPSHGTLADPASRTEPLTQREPAASLRVDDRPVRVADEREPNPPATEATEATTTANPAATSQAAPALNDSNGDVDDDRGTRTARAPQTAASQTIALSPLLAQALALDVVQRTLAPPGGLPPVGYSSRPAAAPAPGLRINAIPAVTPVRARTWDVQV